MPTRSRRPSRHFRAAFGNARVSIRRVERDQPERPRQALHDRSRDRARLRADADGNWDDEQPRWSPDGRRIAFKSTRGGSYNLYVMDADGSNVRRLTNHAANDHDPSWLPDGASMVFTSDRDRGAGRNDLYRTWLADGAVERLTTFFTAMRSCRTCRRMAVGWRLSPDVPDRNRTGREPGARAGTGDEARRGRSITPPGMLAELVA